MRFPGTSFVELIICMKRCGIQSLSLVISACALFQPCLLLPQTQPSEPQARTRISEALSEMLQTPDDKPIRVIVILKTSKEAKATTLYAGHRRTRAQFTQELTEDSLPAIQKLRTFLAQTRTEKKSIVAQLKSLWLVNGVSISTTRETIKQLAERPDVERIEIDEPQFVLNDSPSGLSQVQVDQAWTNFGVTGRNVTIALIDTGVNMAHPDLRKHIWTNTQLSNAKRSDCNHNVYVGDTHGFDFYDCRPDPSDDNGHGTEVAGILIGDGTEGTATGVAPGAHLMVLKALDANGKAYQSSVIQAIQYALIKGADVISMSVGWTKDEHIDRQVVRQACDNAIAAGISVVVSAGNNRSPFPSTITTPGDVPGVITVGAVDSNSVVANFSSQGPVSWTDLGYPEANLTKPDIVAPGVNIVTTAPSDRYTLNAIWGTSIAAPYVTGTVALMIEYARQQNHSLDPTKIKSCLEGTAVHLGVAGKNNDYGSGLLDAAEAVHCAGS
jgi:serine protease AprX